MLITICRLYDSYSDASRVVVMLEAAGLPPSETSVISNNSDTWYTAAKTDSVVPLRKDDASSGASGKVEGAAIGAAIGATAATAAGRRLQQRWWFFLTAATDSALTNINAMSRISLRCDHSTSENCLTGVNSRLLKGS